MTENADKIKILLLGGSQFNNSFDPHVLGDSVFDGASDGRRFYYDVQVMKRYVPHMQNLKTILIPLHACLYVEPHSELYYRYPYAKYMGIPIGNNPFQYSALFSGNFNINSKIIQKQDTCDSMGYSPLFNIWDGKPHVSIKSYNEAKQNLELFVSQIKEMTYFCDSLGVRLIFILPPANDNYINRADPRLYSMLDSTMSTLNNTYNFEYKFYHDYPTFKADSLYADEFHLNHIGASLFAERIKKDFNL